MLKDPQDIRDQLVNYYEEELHRDLHNSLGTALDTTTEETEMRRLSVPYCSNLVSIVALRSEVQEKDDRSKSLLSSLKDLAGVQG